MRWRGEIRRRAAPARQRQVVCPGSAASEADWQELEHDGALIHFPCPDNYLWPTFKANSTRNSSPALPRPPRPQVVCEASQWGGGGVSVNTGDQTAPEQSLRVRSQREGRGRVG